MVMGPVMFFSEASPISILPSIVIVIALVSQVFRTARATASTGGASTITKADDSEGVAAGVTLADADIIAMNWHVKGVATPLPQ